MSHPKTAAWIAAHPIQHAWLVNNPKFPFAVSLYEALQKWGGLTDRQLAAVDKCIAGSVERKLARLDQAVTAPVVSVDKLEAAFTLASSNLKRPRLTIGGLTFSPAGATSKNPGAIYAKWGDTYLGKMTGGKFLKSYGCNDEAEQKVLMVVADPEGEAIKHGKLTGSCAICSRKLTDAESTARGIGPVCAKRFGWGV